MSAEAVIAALSEPCEPTVALGRGTNGGLPAAPGLYAWWVTSPDALPSVPLEPRGDGLSLLYVGIARNRPGSRATLRSRVGGNHLRGNIGASTFRLTLASLLWEQEGWTPVWRRDRPVLSPEDNRALSVWQREHLRVAWCTHDEPWAIEKTVIEQMKPPLNLAGNEAHAFRRTLTEARAALRSAAAREV